MITDIIIMIPLLVIVGTAGIAVGMYISSQIEKHVDKRIKKLGEEEGFLVINLANEMKNHAEKNQTFLHGFSNSVMGQGHWNLEGHKIASQIISKKVCKSL